MTKKECFQAIADGKPLINKETGVIVRRVNGKAVDDEGNQYNFTFHFDWEIYTETTGKADINPRTTNLGRSVFTEEQKRIMLEALTCLEREEAQMIFGKHSNGKSVQEHKETIEKIKELKTKLK